jgi:3',5'-cyclic-AMP phosphodiesterase
MSLNTSDIRLVQITDPHLRTDPAGTLRGVVSLDALERVLAHALSTRMPADAILCSGDIVNDEPAGYAHFVRALAPFGRPVYCVPGNHDDPAQMRTALARPGFQVGGHVDLGAWRIVLVDSCVPGRVPGRISDAELGALERALSGCEGYALVCVHHHPVAMGSHWLDGVGIENAAEFLAVLDTHPRVRALVWGHVHQCFEGRRQGVRLLATPSTCAQFLPLSYEFAVDARPPAYRRLTLRADGTVETEVIWVEPAVESALRASPRS